jgi:iron complex outermembrane receptor protein
MTLGVRVTDDTGTALVDASPPLIRNDAGADPIGDIFAFDDPRVDVDPDFGRNTTNKFALQYQLNDDVMIYGSWGEGFTDAVPQLINLPVIGPGGCPQTVPGTVSYPQNRELVTSRELGFRSDWRGSTLRFNASYFDASWNGMRVATLATDPCSGARLPNTIISSDGKGEASGFEFEVVYAPTDRLRVNVNLGILDTNYLATGTPGTVGADLSRPIIVPLTDLTATGVLLDSPFAYAPENSLSLGIQYTQPLSSGASLAYIGNYGWMDDYVRDTANHRIPRDENGNRVFEPAYGVLNGRLVFTPNEGNWTADVYMTNITDEQYVNGGFDTRTVWGFNFSVIGQPREFGVGLNISF